MFSYKKQYYGTQGAPLETADCFILGDCVGGEAIISGEHYSARAFAHLLLVWLASNRRNR